MNWFSDWFTDLSEPARARWWTGVYLASSPHIASDVGDARWGEAAAAFGEAVALELKERVFKPFGASVSSDVGPLDDHWRRVLAGKGTLGEMVHCVVQTQWPQSTIAKALRQWLQGHSAFQGFIISTGREQLLRLPKLRNPAQHETVTEAEARRVFLEASEWLRVLTKNPRGLAPV